MVLDISSIEFKKDSEKKVFITLCNWNYGLQKANYFNIAKSTELSESTITKILRLLKERNLIGRNLDGSYYIRKELVKHLTNKNDN